MGTAALAIAPIIKAIGCHDCARYVCNAMHMHSKCSDCCEVDLETDQVSLSSSSSDGNCCQ